MRFGSASDPNADMIELPSQQYEPDPLQNGGRVFCFGTGLL